MFSPFSLVFVPYLFAILIYSLSSFPLFLFSTIPPFKLHSPLYTYSYPYSFHLQAAISIHPSIHPSYFTASTHTSYFPPPVITINHVTLIYLTVNYLPVYRLTWLAFKVTLPFQALFLRSLLFYANSSPFLSLPPFLLLYTISLLHSFDSYSPSRPCSFMHCLQTHFI